MPVTHFAEVSGRDESINLDTEQRATRTFEAYTDAPLDDSTTVRLFDQSNPANFFPPGTPGAGFNGNPQRRVPKPGDKFVVLDAGWSVVATNDHVVCVEVRVDQNDASDPQKWVIVCQYAGVSDPVAQPAEVDWDPVPYQIAILTEADAPPSFAAARPILNAAGDPFAEGVMTDKDRYTLTITRNVVSFRMRDYLSYQNTTNLNTYLGDQEPPGYAQGTAKLKLKARRVRRSSNTDFYWRVTATVEIDPDGWDAKVRDAGYNYINPDWGKDSIAMHPRFIGRGQPATPQLLKPDGTLALPTEPVPAPLRFRRFTPKDWTPLNWLLNY
jgi:hypothetical protein